ncbi:MAG: FHA domain-containing protein, partial [Microlunatus sp.]|nr:FHA domain-containing protein [Microlunatus sp.]
SAGSAASAPDSFYRPDPPYGSAPSSSTRTQLVLEVNGVRHPLEPPGFNIGRGTDADLRINDPGISRLHAEIRVHEHAGALAAEILDLGSTNGISVNGHKVQRAPLDAGTRIEIGSTRMLVHAPAGR